jgi:ethanolamine transporter EutH
MISVSMATHTNEMKPIIVPSYRLLGAGVAAVAATLCATMLRPADEAAATRALR